MSGSLHGERLARGTEVDSASSTRALPSMFRWVSVWGTGLLVMLADTDAGNVVTAAQAGAQWGYRLLPRCCC